MRSLNAFNVQLLKKIIQPIRVVADFLIYDSLFSKIISANFSFIIITFRRKRLSTNYLFMRITLESISEQQYLT